MGILKKYIEYLKDNPKGYWFKRKIFGWGWVPARREGWLVMLVFMIFLLWTGFSLSPNPTSEDLAWFYVKMVVAIAIVIFICYVKGESPRWQWGLPKKDENSK